MNPQKPAVDLIVRFRKKHKYVYNYISIENKTESQIEMQSSLHCFNSFLLLLLVVLVSC